MSHERISIDSEGGSGRGCGRVTTERSPHCAAPSAQLLAWGVLIPSHTFSFIFIFSLQYLSSLLRGTASRTRVLWGRKYNSFQRWSEREVDEARYFRRAVCHAIGQIELRHVRKFRRLPWRMFTFSDTRRSVLERERLSLTFNTSTIFTNITFI